MQTPTRRTITRPTSARAVSRRAHTLEEFGRNLRDWFHELKRLSSRRALLAAVIQRPPRLVGRFGDGAIADAFLAGQVEQLCIDAGVPPPRWVRDPVYVLDRPWFSIADRAVRPHLLRDAPAAFKNRNLFTTPEIRFEVRRGRPRKTAAELREANRLRQQRFRVRQVGIGR